MRIWIDRLFFFSYFIFICFLFLIIRSYDFSYGIFIILDFIITGILAYVYVTYNLINVCHVFDNFIKKNKLLKNVKTDDTDNINGDVKKQSLNMLFWICLPIVIILIGYCVLTWCGGPFLAYDNYKYSEFKLGDNLIIVTSIIFTNLVLFCFFVRFAFMVIIKFSAYYFAKILEGLPSCK